MHVSCLAEQAKILIAEAEENNLGQKTVLERWQKWESCRLCEQRYHSVVLCALGWACWKTYVGRPEMDGVRGLAMNLLGNGLHEAGSFEDALSVKEARETERTARRVFGGAHPVTTGIEGALRDARATLRARETPPPPTE